MAPNAACGDLPPSDWLWIRSVKAYCIRQYLVEQGFVSKEKCPRQRFIYRPLHKSSFITIFNHDISILGLKEFGAYVSPFRLQSLWHALRNTVLLQENWDLLNELLLRSVTTDFR